VKLIFDHNLSKYIGRSLNALFNGEHLITSIEDFFDRKDVSDLEWIERLGSEGGWTVMSADIRISKNKIERDAFRRAGLVGFFLSSGLRKKSVLVQTARILIVWDRLITISELTRPGLFELQERGEKFPQIGR
jgi:hypothetical protein